MTQHSSDLVFDNVARACNEVIASECGECGGSLAADVAKAALEASYHAELVEALREMVNIASSLAVAFNYTDPDVYLAMGEARTLLLAKISGNSPALEEGDAQNDTPDPPIVGQTP